MVFAVGRRKGIQRLLRSHCCNPFSRGRESGFFLCAVVLHISQSRCHDGITAPALGGGVPFEEYVFYFTGFVAVLLLYIWLDEYWLAAYGVRADAQERAQFQRLLRFHPASLAWLWS